MTQNALPEVTIYTDGSCDPNPGPGGWGAILFFPETTRELSGSKAETTNNQMELSAAINALNALSSAMRVHLYTDSQYMQKGITEWLPNWIRNNWRKSGSGAVKNKELWQDLLKATKRHQVEWHWVKAHADNDKNNRVDLLARNAMREEQQRLKTA
jgi:ribonuclease HI